MRNKIILTLCIITLFGTTAFAKDISKPNHTSIHKIKPGIEKIHHKNHEGHNMKPLIYHNLHKHHHNFNPYHYNNNFNNAYYYSNNNSGLLNNLFGINYSNPYYNNYLTPQRNYQQVKYYNVFRYI